MVILNGLNNLNYLYFNIFLSLKGYPNFANVGSGSSKTSITETVTTYF